MIINYEFLGDEPIENVITCMNYKVDRVVFFGYDETIRRQKETTKKFLCNYCGVTEVSFLSLATGNMKSVLEVMRKEIQKESERGNQIFFDITGGESMILVAFGMLAKEFHTPMHMYKVEKNELIDLNCEVEESISMCAPKQDRKYDLSHYICMRGGSITNRDQTRIQCEEDVYAMWEVAGQYWFFWNAFCVFIEKNMVPGEDLVVTAETAKIEQALQESASVLKQKKKLNQILSALASKGIIRNYECTGGRYYFQFKSSEVKNWLWKSGTILELYVYLQEKKISDDCCVSTNLDWDGVVHMQSGVDVHNEIDVLTQKGNILTFISCKSGRLGRNQAMHAMYELETVAERFGGKYIRKVLAITCPLSQTNANRAAEMGIEIMELQRGNLYQ